MLTQFKNIFTKVLTSSILVLMLLFISACADDSNSNNGGTTPDIPDIPDIPDTGILPVWDGETITEIIPVNNVYEISNPNQLAWIVDISYKADYDNFTDKTIKFTDNMSMDNHSMQGIKSFAGRLEGNNKQIHNIKLSNVSPDETGLINLLLDGGYIDNLTISTGLIKGRYGVGAFVGEVEKNATVTIKGVKNNATVEGTNYVGGLVGSIGRLGVSGMYPTLIIDNSSNTGSVSGVESVGGLVGESGTDSTLTISNSSNIGIVKGTGTSLFIGGLVGSNKGTLTITNSSNSKNVTGTGNRIGGLVGYSKGTLTITNSSNIGTVTGTVTGIGNNTTGNRVGGLVGASAGKLTTNNSSNSGNIKGHTDIGGLYGYITLHTDEDRTVNSSNSGNVNGENSVGGIIGGSYSDQYLDNVYSYAKSITSENGGQLGGIVGRHQTGPTFKVQSVYWLHDATVGTEKVGGGGVIAETGHGFSKLTITEFADKNATGTNFLGWDFDTVWEILTNSLYPTLRKQPVTTK